MDIGPAWWVPGAHLQTVWARLARSRRLITFEREVLTTPDDDDLVLDHVAGPPETPRVLLLHGLEGSAHSLHTQGLALLVARAGWRATVLNFRSCARDRARHRAPAAQPAARASITRARPAISTSSCARWSRASRPSPLYALGFSLGGERAAQVAGRGRRAPARSARPRRSPSPTIWRRRRASWSGRSARFYVEHFMHRLRAEGAGPAGALPARDRAPRCRSASGGRRRSTSSTTA